MRIDLRIDRLVLDGLALEPGQDVEVKAVLEEELAKRLVRGGIDMRPDSGVVPYVHADGIQLAEGMRPSVIAKTIAGSVYRGTVR